MPLYKIKHLTRYSYAAPVIDCTNQLMVYPLADEHLQVKHHNLHISHDPEVSEFTDYFGNQVGVFSILAPHTELLIESTAEVVTTPIRFPMDEEPGEQQWQHLRDIRLDAEFLDFLAVENKPELADVQQTVAGLLDHHEKPLKNMLVLSEYVHDHFQYEQGITSIETPVAKIWELKAGVCQDFAHLLLYMLRQAGVPARYVSGYICPREEGVRGAGATHAWVEAYVPFYGWLGLDPTNNCIVNDGHVRMAIGRSFADCTPVKGTYKGTANQRLEVSVHIDNGDAPTESLPLANPVYTRQVPSAPPVNSYRKYVDWQQQQQQQ